MSFEKQRQKKRFKEERDGELQNIQVVKKTILAEELAIRQKGIKEK